MLNIRFFSKSKTRKKTLDMQIINITSSNIAGIYNGRHTIIINNNYMVVKKINLDTNLIIYF